MLSKPIVSAAQHLKFPRKKRKVIVIPNHKSLADAFFITTLRMVAMMPDILLSTISTLVCPFIPFLAKKELRILDLNIEKIHGLPPHSRFARAFKKQIIRHQVIMALETIKGAARPHTIKFCGMDDLEKKMASMEANSKGQVLVTGHLGNWEFIALAAARLTDRKFYALAKSSKFAGLTRALELNRRSMNIHVLWTDTRSFLKDMLATMKAKDWLSFVMDQKPQGRIGPRVLFFGREIACVSGPAQMSLRYQCPVIAVFCVRIAPMSYKLISKEIVAAHHGIESIEEICQIMIQEIETHIKMYPEQWCWNYKRWVFKEREET